MVSRHGTADTHSPVIRSKTLEKVADEYNYKYAGVVAARTIEEACALYWKSQDKAKLEERNTKILDSLRPLLEQVDTVVDLGAGFGQVLHVIQEAYPTKKYIAGELTITGVALGTRLLPDIQFKPFNFYNDDDWSFLGLLENALVITVHSVEMLPDAALFVNKINQYKAHIARVVNFEPIYDDETSAEKRSYIEENGYCMNILQCLPNPIVERDFYGLNPLFPEARLEWSPT